jgi:hypothetical protein
MSQVKFEFQLGRDAADLQDGFVRVSLGNGVSLTTSIPKWVKGINDVRLDIVMDIEGSPPDADTRSTPIV